MVMYCHLIYYRINACLQTVIQSSNVSVFPSLILGCGTRCYGKFSLPRFILALFLVQIPQFPGAIVFDSAVLCVCVWVVFSGWARSVGGVSHKECLRRHLLEKHREHIMSMYEWSGAQLTIGHGDCVKCHTAREDTQMYTVRWHFQGIKHVSWKAQTVPSTAAGQTWLSLK